MGAELVQLRSYHAEPGELLLAEDGGRAAGCVGLRALGPGGPSASGPLH